MAHFSKKLGMQLNLKVVRRAGPKWRLMEGPQNVSSERVTTEEPKAAWGADLLDGQGRAAQGGGR